MWDHSWPCENEGEPDGGLSVVVDDGVVEPVDAQLMSVVVGTAFVVVVVVVGQNGQDAFVVVVVVIVIVVVVVEATNGMVLVVAPLGDWVLDANAWWWWCCCYYSYSGVVLAVPQYS